MSAGYDDRFEGGGDDGRGRGGPPGGVIERARRKVSVPGTLIMLNGLLGIVLWVGFTAFTLANPLWPVEFMRKVAADQPAGQQKQDLENRATELENKLKEDPSGNTVSTAVQGFILVALNAVAVIGGLRMRSLGSWGWGMAGSIVSLIPIATGCCCTGMPLGLWGLIVLVNEDVKAGFAAAAGRTPDTPPTDF
jgi:hypothetical protein